MNLTQWKVFVCEPLSGSVDGHLAHNHLCSLDEGLLLAAKEAIFIRALRDIVGVVLASHRVELLKSKGRACLDICRRVLPRCHDERGSSERHVSHMRALHIVTVRCLVRVPHHATSLAVRAPQWLAL